MKKMIRFLVALVIGVLCFGTIENEKLYADEIKAKGFYDTENEGENDAHEPVDPIDDGYWHDEEVSEFDNLNISWDLKNNSTIKVKTHFNVIGDKKIKVKMTKYKVSKTKDGKKKITFTLKYSNLAPKITVEQGEKMYNDATMNGKREGGMYYWTVIDRKTGYSIEGDNDKGVVVKSTPFKYSDRKFTYLFGSSADQEEDQWWCVYFDNVATTKVTITCPEDYKDMVLIVGGIKYPDIDYEDVYSGQTKFSESKLYVKKDKSFCQAMRLE